MIFVTGIGVRAGRMEEESIVLRHYGRPELGAIQQTTAAACVAMVELFLNGELPAKGFVRQEDATLDGFLATRAGRLLSHGIRRAEVGLAPDGRIGDVERRLAAVLAADVAGYSRLMGADEVGTLAALKALRREIVDPTISEHHGRIVKTTGDGVLVEFASAVAAVNCAMEVQAKMAERSRSASLKIAFRVGINVGDIIIDRDDIFGDGVNVAARIENECEPGGVCLSGSAFEQIRGKTQFTFDDLGERSLKNIDRPIRLYTARSAASSPAVNMVRQTEKRETSCAS